MKKGKSKELDKFIEAVADLECEKSVDEMKKIRIREDKEFQK